MLRYSKERLAEERSITDIYFKAQEELDIRKELYREVQKKTNRRRISKFG